MSIASPYVQFQTGDRLAMDLELAVGALKDATGEQARELCIRLHHRLPVGPNHSMLVVGGDCERNAGVITGWGGSRSGLLVGWRWGRWHGEHVRVIHGDAMAIWRGQNRPRLLLSAVLGISLSLYSING